MTVKEIAKAVGKEERSVHNWVKQTSAENAQVYAKIAQAKETSKAADYTLEEVCQIIESGMGKDVAGVFMANAKNPAKDIRPLPNMAELRRAFDRGLISADEYRIGIGLNYPKSDMLDPQIAKQVYAVTCSAIDRKKKQQLLEDKSGKLF